MKETDYERESALQGWEGVKLMTVVVWCVSGAKDLRFVDREFHKWGDELQNERSANFDLMPGENRWKCKAQMIRGTSSARRFDICEPVKVLWFGCMDEIVCNGDDLILNALFDFKLMKRLEYWGDMKMFGSADNGKCKSIFNMLKAFNLSDE